MSFSDFLLWLFTGIDLGDLANLASVVQSEEDAARKSRKIYPLIKEYQNAFLEIEKVLAINCGALTL